MFQYQTLACLQDIPVVRSSTDIIQQVYTKAKDSSAIIRVPCNVAEYVAEKSVKFASTVTTPFVKPFRGPVEVIDNYAAKQIRLIESKYPLITTPTEDVVNTLTAKTETVRSAVSSVKKSTADKIQHGKETVTNVASATVTKATGVVDSMYGFCEARVPQLQKGKYFKVQNFTGCFSSKSNGIVNEALRLMQTSFSWCRILVFFTLLRIKEYSDRLLTSLEVRTKHLAVVQRVLIGFSTILERLAGFVQPDDRSMTDFKRSSRSSGIYPNRDLVGKQSNLRASFQREFTESKPSANNDLDLNELHQRLGGKQSSTIARESNSDGLSNANGREEPIDDFRTQADSDDD